VFILLSVVALSYAYILYEFPYGTSHCCDLGLYFSLREYAEVHGGNFPAGEATPEASLSLLYGAVSNVSANLLRGKSVPEPVVQEILNQGERLTPETCGWHYVENLRLDDDSRLALFWDKAGLGHNGQRLSGGGHIVMFVDGQRRHILASEWQDFVTEQQVLLAKTTRRAEVLPGCIINIGGEEIRVQLRIADGKLYGNAWHLSTTQNAAFDSQLLAYVDHEPADRADAVPVLSANDVREANVIVDQEDTRARFILPDREIIFERGTFTLAK
jgi:hypothetical protein